MKSTARSTLIASMVASIVGLAIWFAPTHGQPNEDRAQLVDVTVVDEVGDPVVGAPLTVQRHDGSGWVGTGRGGAADSAGEHSIEMPTGQGRYRIVLTVPQGYTEWYDDADGSNPGRNSECAGMVARCVAYDIDAAGSVSLNQPDRNATGLSVTFHVRKNQRQPTLRVEQFDTAGNPIHGGTFTMQPFTIVTVDGQNVRQWGRVSRTGMTTAGRTFNVQPFTSYIIRWEPPAGDRKVTPGAPLFGYEFTTGANGTSTKFTFTVRRSGPAAEQHDGVSLDPNPTEITPSGGVLPSDPQKGTETPDTDPTQEPSQKSPETGGAVEWEDSETVPTEVLPAEIVPTETVPAEIVPTETVPVETVPVETVPVDPELEAELEAESEVVDADTTTGGPVDGGGNDEEWTEEWIELESVEQFGVELELEQG